MTRGKIQKRYIQPHLVKNPRWHRHEGLRVLKKRQHHLLQNLRYSPDALNGASQDN
ncbi:hypothetical protein DPMN_066362, partial [Dreissena polymorpha]